MTRSSAPVMLVVVGKSWGAVDWILPVLHAFRERGLARVCVYFRQDGAYELAPRFADLAEVFHGITSEVWSPSRLVRQLSLIAKVRLLLANWRQQCSQRGKSLTATWYLLLQLLALPFMRTVFRAAKLDESLLVSLLQQELNGGDVEWLLQDFDNNDYRAFYQQFPAARVFVFPHGTNWLADQQFAAKTYHGMKVVPQAAVWFTGRAEDEPIYRRLGLACEVAAYGHPKLDPVWIDAMKERCGEHASGAAPSSQLKMLFLTMPIKKLSDRQRFRDLAASLFRVAARRGVRVLVKLHPNQPESEIRSILRGLGEQVDVEWCPTSVLSAAARADLVVSFPSSAVMDAVAVGTPVFEFFDYTNQRYTSFVSEGGKTSSIYRQQGLVEPLNSEAELEALICRVQQSPTELAVIAERQCEVFDRLLGERDGVLERIVARIVRPASAAQLSQSSLLSKAC